jgi:HAE1 family hydrophobic/amphiphilic exporter-1
MTLGGLALGVGRLVDDAIVVLENIYRTREGGTEAELAAVRGTEEVTAAIIASTLTTVAVFLPLIFVRGMAGIMFKQLAFVVSFALLCSLGVALTLVPMLASRFLHPVSLDKAEHESIGHRLFRLTGLAFRGLELGYKHVLHAALDHRLLVVLSAGLLLVGSLLLVPFVGTELMPQGDEGEVRVDVEMEVGTRVGVVDETMRKVEAIVTQEVPEIESVVAGAGGGSSHTGDVRIALKPQSQRKRSSQQVAAALRPKLAALPGATIRTRASQGLFLLRTLSAGRNAWKWRSAAMT